MRISDWSSDVCSSDLAEFRISASTWNRAIASLDKLYRWAEREGLIERTPFTHRQVWRRSHDGRRAAVTGRNNAYERAARRSDVRFIDLTDYRARSEEHTSELQSLMRISYAVFC